MTERIPAETFPLVDFIRDEMEARSWRLRDVHARLDNDPVRCAAFDLVTWNADKMIILDRRTAEDLALLFGAEPEFWLRLDAAWRAGEVYEKRVKDAQKARTAYGLVPVSSSRYKDAQKELQR